MKQLFNLMVGLLLVNTVVATSAVASDRYSSKRTSKATHLDSTQHNDTFYLGLKGGRMLVDFEDTSGAVATGFVAGYQLNPRFSLEASYIKGTPVYETGRYVLDNNGQIDEVNSTFASNKLNAKVYGLYLNYRSQGTWYLVAKGGMAKADMKGNSVVPGINNTAFSGSLGFGWRVGQNTIIEADVTHIDKYLTYVGVSGILLGF